MKTIGPPYVLRVQRRPHADLALAAGRQQIDEIDERPGDGAGNLLGQLGHVDGVLVVVRLLVRLQNEHLRPAQRMGAVAVVAAALHANRRDAGHRAAVER